MVNANVVISVSAVLVALILTIVIVMRSDGDPVDNFSVSVKGSYVHADGNTYEADMYYCIGADCQFHGHATDDTFPGYYALVGFNDGSDTFVTEHSIGKTFKFNGDTLVSCESSEELDVAQLSSRVEALTASFNVEGKSFSLDIDEDDVAGTATFTISDYVMNPDPKTDTPSVRSKTVPTIAACEAIWKAEDDAACAADSSGGCGGDSTIEEDDEDETHAVVDLTVEFGGERRLGWGSAPNHNAATMADLASFGYSGGSALPGGWHHWANCINRNSVARFGYSYPTMVLSFAGTDDMWDALQDLKIWGNADYHGGFYDYVSMTINCVNWHVRLLQGWGIQLDYITGHSLGGAAAVVYAQRASGYASVRAAKVVTFGAPKTSKHTACKTGGTRIFNEKDPVASNALGVLSGFNHDVSGSKQVYNDSRCTRRWWGICTRTSTYYRWRGAGCNQAAGGCSWFFDCLWNVGRHSLDTYRKHGLSGITV